MTPTPSTAALMRAVEAFLEAHEDDRPVAASRVSAASGFLLRRAGQDANAAELEAALRALLAGRWNGRGDDPATTIAFLARAVEIGPPVDTADQDVGDEPDQDVGAFLAEPEPEYVWVVEGVLERGDRIIVTGPEGGGKSTALRQLGVQMAAGIHPFTLEPVAPVRVLLVDVENSRRQVRRALRPLVIRAGGDLDPRRFRVVVKPEGVDLLDDAHATWLGERVRANRPDVVILGPLYKLANGDPTEERVAKRVATCLDWIREAYGCALIIEAHQAYGAGGKRPERPYGASLWSRWPEFGLYLAKEGHLRHWRGQRDERAWPPALQRGGEWPWTPVTDGRALTFARVLEEVRNAGRRLSVRELEDAIEGASRMTISRAIGANQQQFDDVVAEVEA